MSASLTEMHWLDEHQFLSLADLAQLSGLPEPELRVLVECGVLVPQDTTALTWYFSADCIVLARTARRLRNDFDLDAQGLIVALSLIDRINDLEAQLRRVTAQLPRRPGKTQ